MAIAFWTEDDRQYGKIHRADLTSNRYYPDVLIVFIHGLCGHCVNTWGELPQWLLDKAGIDVDVFTYAYPSMPWQEADIKEAAAHLREVLNAKFPHHQNIVFYVHSTGGLIIKEMLRKEHRVLSESIGSASKEFSGLKSIALRTRRIFNIAVPHAGGGFLLTFLAGLFFAACSLGRHKLIWQLQYGNKWIIELEQDYVSFVNYLDQVNLPRPVSVEILAAGDINIAKYSNVKYVEADGETPIAIRSDSERLEVRGTHKSAKVPEKSTDLIVSILANALKKFRAKEDIRVAINTLARVFNFERAVGIKGLVGKGSEVDSNLSQDGNQIDIFQKLSNVIHQEHGGPRCIVLTGDAGVGKSVVLRSLARSLDLEFLAQDHSSCPLPIFMPLQQVTIDLQQAEKRGDPKDIWGLLVADWCAFANGLLHAEAKSRGYADDDLEKLATVSEFWLEERIRIQPTICILDGVDEFLTNNPAIGLSHFRNMLQELQARYMQNTYLLFLLGVRSSQPGLDLLSDNIYKIHRLTFKEADRLFPGTGAWLNRITDPQLRDLLLTPLILWHLGPHINTLDPALLETRTAIMDKALEAILIKSNLDSIRDTNGVLTNNEHWENALMLVAWRFFSQSRGEITLQDLLTEAKQLTQCWESRLQTAGQIDDAQSLMDGFRLVCNESTCGALLKSTVFYPTGPKSYRFQHREWEDFLAARFLARCIMWREVDDLQYVAFTQSMFRIAGEQLRDNVIHRDLVEKVVKRTRETTNEFILGNFGALLANSLTPMDGPAVSLLLKAINSFAGISKHTNLTGFSYRALKNHRNDSSARSLREALIPVLTSLLKPGATNTINASMAWCYLKQFHVKFSTATPTVPWIGIENLRKDEESTLSMMCTRKDDEININVQQRSLQNAFLRIQSSALQDPDRPISILHYLYFIVVAWRHGGHIAEVERELPSLLAPNSPMQRIFEHYESVPELLQLYQHCQRLYFSE